MPSSLVEAHEIREKGHHLELSQEAIEQLTFSDESQLTEFAKKNKFLLVKVDYSTGQIFRAGDEYEGFMCDVPSDQRAAIEERMKPLKSFTDEETQKYTKGSFWEHIDQLQEPEEYDLCALRALKSFQEGKIDVFQLSCILMYCNYKVENEKGILVFPVTGKEINQFVWQLRIQVQSRDLNLEDQLVAFVKEKLVGTNLAGVVSHPRLLWLALNNRVAPNRPKDPMLPRPVAGYSHRNRFATSVTRPYAVAVPGVKLPETIHGVSCTTWAMDSHHDEGHMVIESDHPYRDRLVALAAILYQKNGENDLYNTLLDRVFFSESNDFGRFVQTELYSTNTTPEQNEEIGLLADQIEEWFRDPSKDIVVRDDPDGSSDIFYTAQETL